MRLIFIFLFSFFSLFGYVYALDESSIESFYTDYSEFKPYNKIKQIDEDLINISKKRMYKFYGENVEGDYFLLGENPEEYPYIDENNYVLNSFTNWSNIYPKYREHRIIEEKEVYKYMDMKKVRYIHFNEFLGGNNRLYITEIEVFVGNNKISYSSYCDGCSTNFSYYIGNNVIFEKESYVQSDGYIKLDLNDYYSLESIKVKVYFNDSTIEEKQIKIYYTRDENIIFSEPTNIYAYNLVRMFFTHKSIEETYEISFDINFVLLKNPEYLEGKYSDDFVSSSRTRIVSKEKLYRYQDKYFFYYDLIRKYLDGYYENYEGYIKDENEYIDSIVYQTRDRLTMKKDIIIDDISIKIDDFINATNDYEIVGDINYNENGIYDIVIHFGNLKINKKVTVNIQKNTSTELPIAENVMQEEKIVKTNINKFNEHNKSEKQENDIEAIKVLSEINDEQNIKNDFKNVEVISNKHKDSKLNFVLLFIVLLLILIIIYFLVKKYRNNNNSTFVETV